MGGVRRKRQLCRFTRPIFEDMMRCTLGGAAYMRRAAWNRGKSRMAGEDWTLATNAVVGIAQASDGKSTVEYCHTGVQRERAH
jgi:hypothetical protein